MIKISSLQITAGHCMKVGKVNQVVYRVRTGVRKKLGTRLPNCGREVEESDEVYFFVFCAKLCITSSASQGVKKARPSKVLQTVKSNEAGGMNSRVKLEVTVPEPWRFS